MKLKFKLSFMVIAILVIVVAGISLLLLSEASKISIDLNRQVIEYLSGERAEFWKGRMDGHMRMLSTLADVMSDYNSIPAQDRRNIYDVMLMGTITATPSVTSLYTVWKPNAVDGMDAENIGRAGSTSTGQYAINFTRETGRIESRITSDIEAATAHFNSPNARKDRVDQPISRNINGKDTYVVRMMAPIISSMTNEVVGGVGMLITIEDIQQRVLKTIEENEIISAMAILTNSGFIIANSYPERIGKNIAEVNTVFGEHDSVKVKGVVIGVKGILVRSVLLRIFKFP